MYEVGSPFSPEAVAALDAELRDLTDESAAYKADIELIRDKRRDVIRRMEPLLAERARLFRERGTQPGDVIVGAE